MRGKYYECEVRLRARPQQECAGIVADVEARVVQGQGCMRLRSAGAEPRACAATTVGRAHTVASTLAIVITTAVPLFLGEPCRAVAQAAIAESSTERARERPPSSFKAGVDASVSHRCAAGVRLVGSVMNARHPERSKAALRNKHGTRVMGPGQRIDDLTLLAVWPTSAVLRNAHGDACYIPVYLSREERPVVAAPAARARPARAKAAPAKQGPLEALKGAVRELGPGRYVVTRAALMQVLADSASLVKSAGVRPLIKDGQSLGMQLVRLRSDSPLRLLGLAKGDVLRHLNGHSLSTPEGMLAVVRMLHSTAGAADLMLGLLRKDVPVNLSIAIR